MTIPGKQHSAYVVIRRFIGFEAAAFIIAAFIHSGAVIPGYGHHEAGVAESVIAAVLASGLAVSWLRPAWTRTAGLAVQGFAFLGTLVGVFTIVIGIGPRTVPDVVYHVFILFILGWGLMAAKHHEVQKTK